MMHVIEWLSQPWPWHISGLMISLVMFLLLYFGKTFGVSSNLSTMCSIAGAGKFSEYFRFNWRDQLWNLVFIGGAFIGGYIAYNYLTPEKMLDISVATRDELRTLGLTEPGYGYIPDELLGWSALKTWKGWLFVVGGGFLIGFGTRYAGGCTSGHAISGLSSLQLSSLIAVVGFFIGGLVMTHWILPRLISM